MILGSIEWVAICYLIANILITAPCVAIPGSLIGLRLRDVWASVRGNLGCALIMAVSTHALGYVLPADWPALVQLAIQVSFGAVIFFVLSFITGLPALSEISELSRHFRWVRTSTV